MKVKLSSQDSLDLLMKFLNETAPDVPDGADLVDSLGLLMDELQWFARLEEIPFLNSFITAV